MSDFQDFNRQIIEEFRGNEGKVGGMFEGLPMLLLHTKGRKTGREFVSPLGYQALENGYAVFGSKGGMPTHPEWYHNVLANPEVSVEVGTETVSVVAHEAAGDERERIWSKQKADVPQFAQYESATKGKRDIPVIVLERVG